jgi:hypothetical protein
MSCVPIVHGTQDIFRLVDGDNGTFAQNLQIRVSNNRRDFEDNVMIGI